MKSLLSGNKPGQSQSQPNGPELLHKEKTEEYSLKMLPNCDLGVVALK